MENLADRRVRGASAVTKKVVGQGGRNGVWAPLRLAQHLKGQQQLFWEKATSQQERPERCIQKPKTWSASHDSPSVWLPGTSLTLSGPHLLQVLWPISE